MARGLNAPQEPDWSDLDPEGRAFAYQPSDWARLVATFAESGELIHPRHERRERTMGELPQLPAAYVESAHFLDPDGREPLLYSGAEAVYDDEEPEAQPAASRPPGRSSPRRRLASAPRSAK
jgi:HemY protein